MSHPVRLTFLAGVPVDPAKRFGIAYRPGAGDETHSCGRCGEPLWIGPKIRGQLALGRRVYCPFCLVRHGALNGETEVHLLP